MPITSRPAIASRTLTVWGGLRTRPYSMGSPPPRNDCSSFVAACLGLDNPLAENTVTLVTRGHVVPISWDQAEPGDVWGRMGEGTADANGHTAIITGTPRTRADGKWEVVQQSGPTGVYGPTRNTYTNPPSGYRAYRSKYVTSSAPVGGGAMALGDRTIRQGDQGDDVYELQDALTRLGYTVGPTWGIWERDGATTDGVTDFQQDQGLVPDGVVGPLTAGRIHAAISALPPPPPPAPPAPPATPDVAALAAALGPLLLPEMVKAVTAAARDGAAGALNGVTVEATIKRQ